MTVAQRVVGNEWDDGRGVTLVSESVEPMEVRDWYHVTITEAGIRLDVAPPGKEPWHADIPWEDITRVCFKAEPLVSDGIYLFTRHRPESYAIPTEADGGSALVGELVKRGLFDAELLLRAASEMEGLYCWPPSDSEPV